MRSRAVLGGQAPTFLDWDRVHVGHTGSTIEGLVHWGMMAARECGYQGPGYGADADHLPVHHPTTDDWRKTRQFIECSRDYSHFTLDVGPVVRWEENPLARLRAVPECVTAAVDVIRAVKRESGFDLEISLDESSEGVGPEDAATRPEEIEWVLAKLAERGIQVSYVAPHLGFHKGGDAVGTEGRERLHALASELGRISRDAGALLSIHSGDYLSRDTRRTLGEACAGQLLFKVSPSIQDLFADAVVAHDPKLAGQWTEFVAELAGPGKADFREYAFEAFGKRDEHEAFGMRKLLYAANEAAQGAFRDNLRNYLGELQTDLGITGSAVIGESNEEVTRHAGR